MTAWYSVTSDSWLETDPILEDGSGPTEEVRATLMVQARNAQRAKVLALRAWRRRLRIPWTYNGGLWSAKNRLRREVDGADFLSEGENPFRGMKVLRMKPQELAELRAYYAEESA